jgi:hypothetical protein
MFLSKEYYQKSWEWSLNRVVTSSAHRGMNVCLLFWLIPIILITSIIDTNRGLQYDFTSECAMVGGDSWDKTIPENAAECPDMEQETCNCQKYLLSEAKVVSGSGVGYLWPASQSDCNTSFTFWNTYVQGRIKVSVGPRHLSSVGPFGD